MQGEAGGGDPEEAASAGSEAAPHEARHSERSGTTGRGADAMGPPGTPGNCGATVDDQRTTTLEGGKQTDEKGEERGSVGDGTPSKRSRNKRKKFGPRGGKDWWLKLEGWRTVWAGASAEIFSEQERNLAGKVAARAEDQGSEHWLTHKSPSGAVVRVTLNDYKTIEPGKCINADMINAYAALCRKEANANITFLSGTVSGFELRSLSCREASRARVATQIGDGRYVFLPWHIPGGWATGHGRRQT